jgi:hypothetical protein
MTSKIQNLFLTFLARLSARLNVGRLNALLFVVSLVALAALVLFIETANAAGPKSLLEVAPLPPKPIDPNAPVANVKSASDSGASPNSASVVQLKISDFQPVTKVVGEVADQFITSREVRINLAVEAAIAAIDALGSLNFSKENEGDDAQVVGKAEPVKKDKYVYKILTGQEKDFAREVAFVLDEWAINSEAKALSASDASPAEIARLIKVTKEFWKGSVDWRAMDSSNEELKAIIERKVVVNAFSKLKGDSSLTPITESDAQQYFRRNRLRFGSVSFVAVKENIITFLMKQQLEKRLESWKDGLRKKYHLRNFLLG